MLLNEMILGFFLGEGKYLNLKDVNINAQDRFIIDNTSVQMR